MKTKALSVFIAFVVCTLQAAGQDYAFKVLVNKGKNEVKSGASWEPVKVGASLKSIDELKVSENSYVGLIHISGKPYEVKDAGKYKIVDLAAKVSGGSSVLNKYTDFILSTANQKKNTLAATGAVTRGPEKIEVYLPTSNTYVFADTLTLAWDDKQIPGPYVVTFSSFWGDELYKTETTENSVTVNLNDKIFAKENDIMVKVDSKKVNKSSDQFTLRKFAKADMERVKANFKEIASHTASNTAINRYYRAAFFEENRLLTDAASAFYQAVKLEPMYQEEYENFLLRTGLKLPPKE